MLTYDEKEKINKYQIILSQYINDLFSNTPVVENEKFYQFQVINPYSFENLFITIQKPEIKPKGEAFILLKKKSSKIKPLYYKDIKSNGETIIKLTEEFFRVLTCIDDSVYKDKYILYKQIVGEIDVLFALQDLETGVLLINKGIVKKIYGSTFGKEYKLVTSVFSKERYIQTAMFKYYKFIFPKIEKNNFLEINMEYRTRDGGDMDLIIDMKDLIYLYELKYKFSRDNMYKATGQLENYTGFLNKQLGIKKPIYQIIAGIKNGNVEKLSKYLERENRKIRYIDLSFLEFLSLSGFAWTKRNENLNILVA
ncbi:MAG: hypothetical protein ACOCUI_04210 [bacterium]